MKPPLTPDLQQLVLSHRWIAFSNARRFAKRFRELPADEFLADAMYALVKAAAWFDASLSVPFGAWATKIIRQALSNTVTRLFRWRRHDQLSSVRDEVGKPVEFSDERAADPGDRAEADESADRAAALCDRLRRKLGYRHYHVLRKRHGEEMTLEAIGRRHGVTRQRARQLVAEAEARARRAVPAFTTA